MNFLIYPPLNADEVEAIQRAAPDVEIVNAADEATARAHIADAEGMYGVITADLLAQAHRLRWLQTPIASLENYMFPELAAGNLTMTNMAGIYSDQIADQVLAYILMFARGLHIYLRRQLAHQWERGVPVIHLADTTLGVVGLGGIGSEVAKRGKALGMRVLAVDAKPRQKPEYVDELWEQAQLDDLLAQSDFVVICVPHTPETVKLITLPRLRQMKPTAYLVNISRGIVVDLADLTDALSQGTIAGAGLDVFEIEPLPADHPLWSMEQVIITPHSAYSSHHVASRRIEVVADNLRRYMAGEPLRNVVDKQRWF